MEKLGSSNNSLGLVIGRLNQLFITNLHLVGLIFCILFAAQFFYLNDISDLRLIVDGDTRGYIYPAFHALEGDGLTLIYARPFIYPFFLAAVGYVTGGIEDVVYVQFFIFFATCYVIYLTCLNLAWFMHVNFENKSLYYFNFIFSLLFCYLFYVSEFQLYMASSARPEIFTSFISVLLIYLITKQLNPNSLTVKVSASILVVIFGSILIFTTQKWGLFLLVVFAISQVILYVNLRNAKKYFAVLISSVAIYAAFFGTNSYLVNKYDAELSKIFGPTVLACSNLDIIAKNIQKNNYAEFDAPLLGDIVKLYNQSASTPGYQRLGFNIDFCLYNQTDNIVALLGRNNIASYEGIKDVSNKMALDSIKSNIDLFLYRVLNQIFVPLTEIFEIANYNIDGSHKIEHVNDERTLTELDNGEYHRRFIESEIVSGKMDYDVPKSLYIVDLIKNNYLVMFGILNLIILVNILLSRNVKQIAVYALAFIVYGASVLPVAMTHSFDIGRYIINTQQIIFLLLFSLIVLTQLALTDLLRGITQRLGAAKKLPS
ncbi:hypothetical protein [Rhizobium sp. RU36D]|uniref:hypothetical protein n=1 Tax=Rhizobium sp. RU36D TaxID=1907415 RepID=UPI0009D79BCD|nr:hypothetical protein [Rhizobium sp. RU36D]SMC49435.1 hypothetical protein SAMN05880593_10245 [Rhizobium sp. RU36D]